MRSVCGQGSCSEEAPLGHTLRYRSCFDSLAFRSNGTGGTLFPLGDKGFFHFFFPLQAIPRRMTVAWVAPSLSSFGGFPLFR